MMIRRNVEFGQWSGVELAEIISVRDPDGCSLLLSVIDLSEIIPMSDFTSRFPNQESIKYNFISLLQIPT